MSKDQRFRVHHGLYCRLKMICDNSKIIGEIRCKTYPTTEEVFVMAGALALLLGFGLCGFSSSDFRAGENTEVRQCLGMDLKPFPAPPKSHGAHQNPVAADDLLRWRYLRVDAEGRGCRGSDKVGMDRIRRPRLVVRFYRRRCGCRDRPC